MPFVPFLHVLEFLFGVCVIAIVAYQLIIPVAKGLPVFPFFRKTQKLSRELSKVKENIEDLKLKKEIDAGKRLIEKSHNKGKKKS